MPKIETTIAGVKVRARTLAFITPAMTDKYKTPNPCTRPTTPINLPPGPLMPCGSGRSVRHGAWSESGGLGPSYFLRVDAERQATGRARVNL